MNVIDGVATVTAAASFTTNENVCDSAPDRMFGIVLLIVSETSASAVTDVDAFAVAVNPSIPVRVAVSVRAPLVTAGLSRRRSSC